MNALAEIRSRFAAALDPMVDDPQELLGMIRPANDAKFGDYQANLAMPLGKKLGKPPRDIATEIVAGTRPSRTVRKRRSRRTGVHQSET